MKGVFCYRNLNRKGVVWSVRSNRTGRVIRRTGRVVLKDVTFKVSQAGRERVLREQRKNVHAGVVGTLQNLPGTPLGYANRWHRLTYNPYKAGYFRTKRGRKVTEAAFVVLTETGCWAAGIR